MKTILFINACLRGQEQSRTFLLAQAYLKELCLKENCQIIQRNLGEEYPAPFTTKSLKQQQEWEKKGIKDENFLALAHEFQQAHEIIIGAPFWEFAFPAVLSSYLENIAVPGVTFAYTEKGSVGLCQGEKMTYFYTSGDFLKKEDKIGEAMLCRLSCLFGISSFESLGVEGLDLKDAPVDDLMEQGLKRVKKLASSAREAI